MAKDDEYMERQLANLGERIKEYRKEKGYSNYEQFAFENRINRSQYGRYETGEDMRFTSLLRVLNALGISLEEFFSKGFEGAKEKD